MTSSRDGQNPILGQDTASLVIPSLTVPSTRIPGHSLQLITIPNLPWYKYMKKEKHTSEAPLGQLEVSVRMARNLLHKVIVGKQSPFVQFEIGDQIHKSACDKRGGRNPQWNDNFNFDIKPQQHSLMVKVFNKTLKSQPFYIGETVIDLIPIMEKREQDAWFTIRDRGEFAGDVYIEFTFHPAGMPRTNLNRSNSRIITEVEEGLSILSLKDLQRSPKINPADFLDPTEPQRPVTAETKPTAPPLQTSNSSASLSSLSSTPDSQLAPANESDLNSILDEIRSLVDYPYHVPVEELPSGPGALPAMRRKPLPQIPSAPRTQDSSRLSVEGYSASQSKVTHKIEGPFPAPRSRNHSTHPSQDIETRTPSPAPSSQISDLILGTPVRLTNGSRRNVESMFSARTGPMQRRGSAESLSTYLEEPDDALDYDPASEIKLVSSTAKSIRRRPMEAPSVMQSFAEPSNRRSPYPEDVRGRPIPYHYHPEGLPAPGAYSPQPRVWAPRPVAYRPVMVSRPLPRPRAYVIPAYPEYAPHPEYAAPVYYSPRPHYPPRPMPHHIHYPRPMPRPGMIYHPNMASPVLSAHAPQPRGQRRSDLPEQFI